MLRAFAAFGVFFTHYALFDIHVGGFGVDIFFIISGFVIAFVVQKSTKDFFLKRVIRVAPLYIVATLLTASLAILKPDWFKTVVVTGEALIKSLLYIPYKIDGSGPILSLGWTLNFEMFFYVSMAICILFVSKKKLLVPICSILLILFLFILSQINVDNYPISFYRDGLLPEFIMGLLLYYVWRYTEKKNVNSIRFVMILLGVLGLVFLIYTNLTRDFSEINRNIRTGIPSLLIVGGGLALEPYINPGSRVVKFFSLVGDSSFAMYLFHPFILFGCTRVLFPLIFDSNSSSMMEIFKFLVVTILLVLASIAIYKAIDRPMNDFLRKYLLNANKTK